MIIQVDIPKKKKVRRKPGPVLRRIRATTTAQWDAIEPHYRAGIRTLKSLSVEIGLSEGAVVSHARSFGWTRTLNARVKARIKALVDASPAFRPPEGDGFVELVVTNLPALALADEVVEAGALAVAQVVMAHRSSAHRARRLTEKLFAELEAVTDHRELFRVVFDALAGQSSTGEPMTPEGREALWQTIRRATSLSGRAATLKALAESLAKITGIERQAFSMDTASTEAPEDDNKPASMVLDRYAEGMASMRERFAAVLAARNGSATTVEPKAERIITTTTTH